MAAIGALIRGDLPPAGNRIIWHRSVGGLPIFPGYRGIDVQSGTAALALALRVARAQRPEVIAPEVVLPGYSCPDLVAAADYAGLRVRLADIGGADPGYRLEALNTAIGANTVAVVAVNFLGIRERFDLLRPLLTGRGVLLIEDDAQWFPEPLVAPALQGDMVSLSFGRGKPVSLLGGGALYLRDEIFDRLLPGWVDVQRNGAGAVSPLVQRSKFALYNLLRFPPLYGLLSRNPLLHIGVTRYKPLASISALDLLRGDLLAANIKHQLDGDRSNERLAAEVIAEHGDLLVDLPVALSARCGRLLRYPVLCRDVIERDHLWRALRQGGVGATALYRCHLPQVEGMSKRFSDERLPGAAEFASRILTLPLHEGVKVRHWQRIHALLSMFASR